MSQLDEMINNSKKDISNVLHENKLMFFVSVGPQNDLPAVKSSHARAAVMILGALCFLIVAGTFMRREDLLFIL